MNDKKPNILPFENQGGPLGHQGEAELPTPLNIIRAPVAFGRMPIHNLSKSGAIDIRVIQRSKDNGRVELYWKVSPNRDAGEPRQLAYKIDTLIINRRLDEIGWPIPRIVKLGSLYGISKELGHGKNTEEVKKALRQNARVFITAKLRFQNIDGQEETLEGDFNRYNLIIRGESLPDGHRAETVYLIFNDPYYSALNRSRRRPLDWDYMRSLAPAAQRFFELLSFEMYAALKFGHPYAKLVYSKYCSLAPQSRFSDRQLMQKQMRRLHQPHIAAGYIEKEIRYERFVDDEGQADWILLYTPGPLAKRYSDESKNPSKPRKALQEAPKQLSAVSLALDPSRAPARSVARNSRPLEGDSAELYNYFRSSFHSVTDATASSGEAEKIRQLLSKAGSLAVARKVVDWILREARNTNFAIQNAAGLFANGYVDRALEYLRGVEKQNQEACALKRKHELEGRYYRFTTEAIEGAFAALTPEEQAERIAEARAALVDQELRHGRDIEAWIPAAVERSALSRAKQQIERELNLPDFKTFRESQSNSEESPSS
jgi:hypothetical protein